jgi:L-fuconolactonase
MRIDSHQHFWRYSAEEYPWIGPGMECLARDHLPAELAAVAAESGIGRTVAVQARQSLEETHWLLELADEQPLIAGVVGWVDLRSPGVVAELARFADRPRLVGVRHVVQDEPDPRFLLGEAFVRGLRTLRQFGLTYDLLVYPQQLPAAIEIARLLPEQPFVLDHLAKPQIKAGDIEEWRRDIRALAGRPNVCCKVSGLVTEAAWKRWQRADFAPYLEAVLEAFGPERLMFGSDWPVCLLSAEYREVVGIVEDLFARLTPGERSAVWGGTAARFYGLSEE